MVSSRQLLVTRSPSADAPHAQQLPAHLPTRTCPPQSTVDGGSERLSGRRRKRAELSQSDGDQASSRAGGAAEDDDDEGEDLLGDEMME